MDDRVPSSVYHSSTVSQSDRAGRTQRAIRTSSYLKRPSFPSMKPTAARRFSHWHNVPSLLPSRASTANQARSSLSPKCRPKSSSCFSVRLSRPMCPACQLIFKPIAAR